MQLWAGVVEVLTGLALAIVISFTLFTVSIKPLLDYDIDSFYNTQSKSAVYTRSLTNIIADESSGARTYLYNLGAQQKQLDSRMFTVPHMIMMPAVDTEEKRAANMHGAATRSIYVNEAATPAIFIPQAPDRIATYPIDLLSLTDKWLTLSNNTWLTNVQALRNKWPLGSGATFNAVVSGQAGDSSLLFYTADKKEREITYGEVVHP